MEKSARQQKIDELEARINAAHVAPHNPSAGLIESMRREADLMVLESDMEYCCYLQYDVTDAEYDAEQARLAQAKADRAAAEAAAVAADEIPF